MLETRAGIMVSKYLDERTDIFSIYGLFYWDLTIFLWHFALQERSRPKRGIQKTYTCKRYLLRTTSKYIYFLNTRN